MDRADRAGLAVAALGHLALLALLTFGLVWRKPPVKPPVTDTMDVQLVDAVGLRSAAPQPASEAPREMTAPEQSAPAEAPPPEPEPATQPPSPKLAPPEVKPAPAQPKPPPKPAPEPKPAPKAVPSPQPAPIKPASPKEEAKPAKTAPTAKATPAKPASRLSDILKDVRSAARNEHPGGTPDAKPGRAAAQRLGPDFLKGVLGKSAGTGEHAHAAVSGVAMNGLGAAIRRQIQPCYDLGGLGGTPAMQITTVLQLRFNQDGSVAGTPQLVEQQGVDDGNRAYAKQMVEVSRRAVLRCAPLKLPAELYAGGWENIVLNFVPGQLR